MRLEPNIDDVRKSYTVLVRDAAKLEREKVTTLGKELTYLYKARQAEHYLANRNAGSFITEEARRLGVSLDEAAKVILDASRRTETSFELIDRVELDVIAAISQLNTVAKIYGAYKAISWGG